MGDRAYTTLLAWPYPGREHLPAELVEQLTRHRFLPDTDHPQEHGLWDGDGAAVVAGDSDSGGILLCVDEQANYGTAAYTDLIGALVRAELHVYAGNEAGADYGAGWEYHPPLGAGRTVQRRRCDQGDMSLIASDLLNPGERRLDEISDRELARRTRALLAPPTGVPEAVLAVLQAEQAARTHNLGVWRECHGKFRQPTR